MAPRLLVQWSSSFPVAFCMTCYCPGVLLCSHDLQILNTKAWLIYTLAATFLFSIFVLMSEWWLLILVCRAFPVSRTYCMPDICHCISHTTFCVLNLKLALVLYLLLVLWLVKLFEQVIIPHWQAGLNSVLYDC